MNFIFQKPDLFPLCDPKVHINSLRQKLKGNFSFEQIKKIIDSIGEETLNYVNVFETLKNNKIDLNYMELYLVFFLCEQDT